MSHRCGRALAAALLLGVTLSSCEADPDEAYCEALREERRVLDELADEERGTDTLSRTTESLQRLEDVAPSELADEYATVVNAWEALADAVDDAGVDPAQFRPDRTPEGIDPRTARRLRQTADTLASPRVVEATLGIEDHAQQVCDVDMRE
jgi:hypothetical protein